MKTKTHVSRLRGLATELHKLGYEDYAEELREDANMLARVGPGPAVDLTNEGMLDLVTRLPSVSDEDAAALEQFGTLLETEDETEKGAS